jgi:cell division protein FtsN
MSMPDDPTGPRRGNPNNRQGQPPHYPDQRYSQRQPRPASDPYAAYPQGGDQTRGPSPADVPRQPAYSGFRPPAPQPADQDRFAQAPRQWEQPAQGNADLRRQPAHSQIARPVNPPPTRSPQTSGFYEQRGSGFQEQRGYAPQPNAPERQTGYEQQSDFYQSDSLYDTRYPDIDGHRGDVPDYATGYDAAGQDYARTGLDYTSQPLPDRFAPTTGLTGGGLGNATAPLANPQDVHNRFFVHEGGAADYGYDAPQQPGEAAPVYHSGQQSYDYNSDAHQDYAQMRRQDMDAPDWGDYGNDPQITPPSVLAHHDRYMPEDDADFFADEHDYEGEEAAPHVQRRGRKKMIAAVAVATLVIGGGVGYYLTDGAGMFGGDRGSPRIVSADGAPVKEAPANPGGRQFANQTKKIYDRLGGVTETDASIAGGRDEITTTSTGQQFGSIEERIANAERLARQRAGQSDPANPDEPRIVSTLLYRPDGSPITPPPAAQPATAFPGLAVATPPGQPAPRPSVQPAPFSSQREPASAGQAAPAPRGVVAPAQPRPEAVAATPAAAQDGGPGFYLQLSSSDDESKARIELSNLQRRFASVLGDTRMNIQTAEINGKVWHRIRVGPVETKEAASDLCLKLKAAGARDCLVRAQN